MADAARAPRIDTRIEERTAGRIAHVTVDHPGKLNILNRALIAALGNQLTALADDESLRAVVLRGAGERAFIGGADIRDMALLDDGSARDFITLLHRACDAARRLPVPVIARIEGYALGAGLEVAAACDLRIAADGARFGMPEVKVGIPSVIEAALLPSLIGWGRTRRLLYTGETIDATEAERWGLVERCVPKAELDGAVEQVLEAILACGPRAIRLQKALIREWEDLPLSQAIARGITRFGEAFQTDEPQRMMAAFLAGKARQKK
ncbi:MAG TPA: enoyl-CoA hydratase [Stellaceae bacterium]